MDLSKKPGEGLSGYLWRIGSAKDAGLISESWSQLADIMNKQLFEDESDYMGESAYRKRYSYAKDMYNEVISKQDASAATDGQIRQLEKERKKLQTEKLEYNKWLREEARDELIIEKILDAIDRLEPLDIPDQVPALPDNKSYMLVFGDEHYGVEFEIRDLYGEIINAYSPEIFEERMVVLMNKVLDIIDKNDIKELTIFSLGDGIDGLLRLTSQLMKLRYGVVESTMRYAEYLSNWLNVLSKYVRIKFQMVKDSNHTQLRLCGDKKNAFPEENMNRIMLEFIKLRLKDNPNVVIQENPTGYCYANMSGWMVFGYHGEQKNIGRAIDDFSRAYDAHIDYMVSGHRHHSSSEEVGRCREAIVTRSFIGVDPYSMSLNKTSNPGASLLCFSQSDGLECEYKIKLG